MRQHGDKQQDESRNRGGRIAFEFIGVHGCAIEDTAYCRARRGGYIKVNVSRSERQSTVRKIAVIATTAKREKHTHKKKRNES